MGVNQPGPLCGGALGLAFQGRVGVESGPYRAAHAALAVRESAHIGCAEGPLQEDSGVVSRSRVHSDMGIRGPGLVREGSQGSGQIGTAVVGHHNGSDVYFLKN